MNDVSNTGWTQIKSLELA